MAKNKAKHKKTSYLLQNKDTMIHNLLLGLISLFLLITPFYAGLFNGGGFNFDKHIFSSFIYLSIILGVATIALFQHHTLQISSLFIWLIPLSFYISTFQAASYYSALKSVYIHLAYAGIFIIGVILARKESMQMKLAGSILCAGYVIVIFGFMNWFGDASLWGLIQYKSSTLVTYQEAVLNNRLSSVFQYPNTYAALLIGLLLGTLYLITLSKKWWWQVLLCFMLVPMALSFLLTLSRGALLFLPLVFVLVLFFVQLHKQIMMSIYVLLTFVASLVIYNRIDTIGKDMRAEYISSTAFKGWLILIGASIIVAAIIFVLHRYVQPLIANKWSRLETRKFTNVVLPALLVIVGVAGAYAVLNQTAVINMLPETLQQRVKSINLNSYSFITRDQFNKDAMEIVKDYPVFGVGGGGWSAMYEKYQAYPYSSRQAHNFYMQYLVESGWVGFAILTILVGGILILFMRKYIHPAKEKHQAPVFFFIMIVSLLAHSAMDFNLSYVYIGALLFLCLGALAAQVDRIKWHAVLTERSSWVKYGTTSLMAIVTLILLIQSTKAYNSFDVYADAVDKYNAQEPFHEIVQSLEDAISMSPNPEYMNFFIDLYRGAYVQTKDEQFADEAFAWIDNVEKDEPYQGWPNENRKEDYALNAYKLYMFKGELEQALQVLNEQLEDFPWKSEIYETAINVNYQLGYQLYDEGNVTEAEKYWSEGYALYEQVVKKAQEFKDIGIYTGRQFNVTPNMNVVIGEYYYKIGEYVQAEQQLASVALFDKLETEQDAASKQMYRLACRYWIASKAKQGQDVTEQYNTLTSLYPEEVDILVQLEQLPSITVDR
ncbi:O-antigen ligase family protein [Longirhabdus pacifica]|uniref:O-antigen ligase family protein n=1 Tax=Longirhabdus pacifica TaxID=2305227 RepID=UPI0013E8DA27|nr:O-antigen ligase family protein [Longirhabdus pacifica]